jgi:prophage DNA circulation protein
MPEQYPHPDIESYTLSSESPSGEDTLIEERVSDDNAAASEQSRPEMGEREAGSEREVFEQNLKAILARSEEINANAEKLLAQSTELAGQPLREVETLLSQITAEIARVKSMVEAMAEQRSNLQQYCNLLQEEHNQAQQLLASADKGYGEYSMQDLGDNYGQRTEWLDRINDDLAESQKRVRASATRVFQSRQQLLATEQALDNYNKAIKSMEEAARIISSGSDRRGNNTDTHTPRNGFWNSGGAPERNEALAA